VTASEQDQELAETTEDEVRKDHNMSSEDARRLSMLKP
jgi:hypothetical protein